MKRWIADYRCKGCGHEFSALAGPENGQCPSCGGIYLDWLNYGALARKSRSTADGGSAI